MNNKLSVSRQILGRQIKLVDRLTSELTDDLGGVVRFAAEPSRSTLRRMANDFDGLANFLSELNAQLAGTDAVVVYKGKGE